MDGWRTLTTLNQEWLELSGTEHPPAAWQGSEPTLSGAEGLDGVLELIRRTPDEVLAALLRLGAAGDGLAHRVILQAMLGMAVRACRGRPEILPDAVAELWLAIAEYPLATRPRSIAANLAWTVRRHLCAASAPLPMPEAAEPAEDVDGPATLAEARRLGLIDELTHRTLWTVYVAGLTSAQAATVLGCTPDLVRWRCSRALRRLSAHAELLAA